VKAAALTKVSSDYERIAQLLNLLGNTDSLKILNHAVKGFKSGKTTIKELEVTPRKYYRNLKTLIDLDLVRMYDDCYTLTPLGRVLHRLLFSSLAGFFNTNVNSADYLEEVNKTKEMTIIDNYNDLIKFLVLRTRRFC
jgi:predicted transcriptional regulator